MAELERNVPGAFIRAFADDHALLTDDFFRDAQAIIDTFKDFGEISGLDLNMKKTVLIPLWIQSPIDTLADLHRHHLIDWIGSIIDSPGKYLGIEVGPGRGLLTWDKPLCQYVSFPCQLLAICKHL